MEEAKEKRKRIKPLLREGIQSTLQVCHGQFAAPLNFSTTV